MSAEKLPERPAGLPMAGLGGYDDAGFTVSYVGGAIGDTAYVEVVLGCEGGETIAFKMEAPVARKFFDQGYALMEAARKAESDRHARGRIN